VSKRLLLVSVTAMAMVLGLSGTADAAVCADYSNQADAQRAADTRDADGDGIYCEALPCPCLGAGTAPAPKRPSGPSPAEIRRRAEAKRLAAARRQAAARRRAAARRKAAAKRRKEARLRRRYEGKRAQVHEVVDGDTVRVVLASTKKRITVRLIGIDTPETRKPAVPVECGAPEATKHMNDTAFVDDPKPYAIPPRVGRLVTIDTDETQDVIDRHGRLLAYLDTDDGTDLGLSAIQRGWSRTYVFRKRFQRYGQYRAAQAVASTSGFGAWSLCGGDFHAEQ
jgi:micrococcal nuclease